MMSKIRQTIKKNHHNVKKCVMTSKCQVKKLVKASKLHHDDQKIVMNINKRPMGLDSPLSFCFIEVMHNEF